MVEYDRTENPLRDKLVKSGIAVKNGRIKIPDEPGLGVSIDETVLKKYLSE